MREVADGIWQLQARPPDMFNVYLAGEMLVDGGTRWRTARTLRDLQGKKVGLVALTHCHPDHQGVVRAVCEKYRATLACHEADVPAMMGTGPMLPDNWLMRIGHQLWSGPSYPVSKVLHDGDELAGFRVIHTPGHTPGHVLFFREADRVALAGDLLANINFLNGKPGLHLPPPFFCVNPGQNRRSLQILFELKPKVVLFGHGPPLVDMAQLERFRLHPHHHEHARELYKVPGKKEVARIESKWDGNPTL